MKIGTTEIRGKTVKVHEMEFLYTYVDGDGREQAVFEFDGEKIEAAIEVFKRQS